MKKKSVKIFFLVIPVNYDWRHYFIKKVILVKLKIPYLLMLWSKWSIIWSVFFYCKIIIRFLELFLANCFLCIFETQLGLVYFFLFWTYLSLCMQVMMYTTVYYTYSHFVVHDYWLVTDWVCIIQITLFFLNID